MKNKFIIVLSLVFVFGLFVTAFAFNGSAPSAVQTDCPMKMNAASTENVDMKNVVVVRSGEDCCEKGADCCKGGSCCKHKK